MNPFARMLIIFGGLLIILGLTLQFVDKIPLVGKLPGDIHIKRENFSFYFPVTTCLLISAVLSLLFYIFGRK